MRFNVSSDLSMRVCNFVEKVNQRTEARHAARHQNDHNRRAAQNLAGKYAELIINEHMGGAYEDEILRIEGGGEVADVVVGSARISVKSQDKWSQERYGKGRFVFEESDLKTIAKGEYTHLALVLINEVGWNYVDYELIYLGPIADVAVDKNFVDPEVWLTTKKILDFNLFETFDYNGFMYKQLGVDK